MMCLFYFLTTLYFAVISGYDIISNYSLVYSLSIPLIMMSTYIISVLLTGLVHFTFDNYFTTNTPIIGIVVHEFREHHTDPGRIVRRSTLQAIEHVVIVGIFINLLLLFVKNPFIIQILIGSGFFGIITNIVHRYNHLKPGTKMPLLIEWAQKLKLIQNNEEHNVHHTAPHTTSFFILSDIFNPYFNKKDIWRKITIIVKSLTGVKAIDF